VAALSLDGEIGELLDPEEGCTGNVFGEIGLAPRLDAVERVAAVDEPVEDQ
jgi:hypothetical protein